MASHFIDAQNRSYPLSDIKDVSGEDVTVSIARRETGTVGDSSNNFLGGAPVQIGTTPTKYVLVITSISGGPGARWEYATSTLRNTALTDLRTAMEA